MLFRYDTVISPDFVAIDAAGDVALAVSLPAPKRGFITQYALQSLDGEDSTDLILLTSDMCVFGLPGIALDDGDALYDEVEDAAPVSAASLSLFEPAVLSGAERAINYGGFNTAAGMYHPYRIKQYNYSSPMLGIVILPLSGTTPVRAYELSYSIYQPESQR